MLKTTLYTAFITFIQMVNQVEVTMVGGHVQLKPVQVGMATPQEVYCHPDSVLSRLTVDYIATIQCASEQDNFSALAVEEDTAEYVSKWFSKNKEVTPSVYRLANEAYQQELADRGFFKELQMAYLSNVRVKSRCYWEKSGNYRRSMATIGTAAGWSCTGGGP